MNKEITFYEEAFKMPDSKLGWRVIPNCNEKRVIKIIGRDTIYDVCYSSDEYGRRISEESIHSDTAKENSLKIKHAIFLGCSFTFGEGLNDTSTFPFLFEYFHPDYKSLNYGAPGYGPNQSCFLFDEGINTINKRTIPGDSGFCIYTYIDDHLNRVYGSSVWLPLSEGLLDVYVNNNKLVCKKRPYIQTHIDWFLNNSETMKYFNITTNYPKTEKFYQRFAGIINYTARKYWSIKSHGDFYVGLYPYKYCVMDTSWLRFLDEKIKVINIPPPSDFEANQCYAIKNDGHPTKELNSYYEKEISKLMFKK